MALAALCTLVAMTSSTAALGDETCTNRYTEPSTGRVDVDGSGSVTGTSIGFQLVPQGSSDAMQLDTIVFHVNGPDGAKDIQADRYLTARYTPASTGHFTVTATWTRYDCADIGRETYTNGSTPESAFEITAGVDPAGARYSTTKRPRVPSFHAPGDAAVQVQVKCPDDAVATHDPVRVDVYWTTNGRPATHSSKRVWTRGAQGCWSNRFTRSKPYTSARLNAAASGVGAQIDVFEPLKADVLIEVHSGSKLVSSKRARFRRTSTGMGVKLSAA
jgi:hypothetical protein